MELGAWCRAPPVRVDGAERERERAVVGGTVVVIGVAAWPVCRLTAED